MAAAASEERTKYKALVKYYQQTIWRGLGKDPEEGAPSDEKVAALARIMEVSKLTPTRMDRRFPNVNQANACWTAFNEYQLCVEKRGRHDALCLQRGRDYSTICPSKWVENYVDSAERGVSMSVGTAILTKPE